MYYWKFRKIHTKATVSGHILWTSLLQSTSGRLFLGIVLSMHRLVKLCDESLKAIISNKFNIKNPFLFAKDVEDFHSKHIITSFDGKALFSKILPKEAFGISVGKFKKKISTCLLRHRLTTGPWTEPWTWEKQTP